MTLKEIRETFDDTKVYVNGKSREIQKKLFSFGYRWCMRNHTEVSDVDEPFLFIYKEGYITHTNNMRTFTEHEHREISADEILSLELTESTYRPFKDKKECGNEMLNHKPFGWLTDNYHNCYRNITAVYDDKIELTPYFNDYGDVFKDTILYTDALKRISFFDGTPFGIKEE